AGITTARDCGGEFQFLTTIRDEIERHRGLGPRLLLAGLVDASGPDAFGDVSADTPEQGRAVVQRYKAAGFQQVKLYTLLKPDVVKAISEEAHRLDMTVTGHVPSALTAITGVEAGMDQVNMHGFVTPSLRPPSENRIIIGALHKAGIPIVAGSDTGLIGYGLHRELELYVQSGMTPLEAIQTATIAAARAMNLASESGSVEPGKRADLILVNGNPL